MNAIPQNDPALMLLLICVCIVASLAAMALYPGYIGITRRNSLFVWSAALLCATCACIVRGLGLKAGVQSAGGMPLEKDIFPAAACAFLFVLLTVPFAAKLYLRLVAGQPAPRNKAPHSQELPPGIIGDSFAAALIAVTGWLAYDSPFLATLGICMLLMLLYPLLNHPQEAPRTVDNADLAASRDRILQMLADGKITADDSIGLLTALGTSALRQASPPLTHGRKLVLFGAALVLLGFFLPWFSFNLQKELEGAEARAGIKLPAFSAIAPQFRSQVQSFQKSQSNTGDSQEDFMMINSPNTNIVGGDIVHGLGWLVLALAMGAAALPYLARHLDRHTQRTLTFLALGIGAVVLTYLLSQFLRAAAIGIVFAVCGYVCAFIGEVKDSCPAAAA